MPVRKSQITPAGLTGGGRGKLIVVKPAPAVVNFKVSGRRVT
jgi:hypothetical protein